MAEYIKKARIMDDIAITRAVRRIAFEIIEKNRGTRQLCLIGIQRRGVILARRIAQQIAEIEGVQVPVGVLDITFYRDDLSMLNEHPVLNDTEIDFMVDDSQLVLVDDVLYTGRTVRAAIDAVMDLGRPQCIQLAILIDRGHRELPIRADFVGKNVPTSGTENVHVMLEEIDGAEEVRIMERMEEEC